MSDRPRSHEDRAKLLLEEGQFQDAAEYFTVGAFGYFGQDRPNKYGTVSAHGLYLLQHAAVCHQLADQRQRAQNRSQIGVLLSEDLLHRALEAEFPDYRFEKARRGVWYEYIGDFRTIGRLGGAAEAYDDAIEFYREHGNPDTEVVEQEHTWSMRFVQSLGDAIDEDTPEFDSMTNDLTLIDWVEYKRRHLHQFLELLYERGVWQTKAQGDN